MKRKKEVVSFRVDADIARHLRTKKNVSAYLRRLILNEKKRRKEKVLKPIG